ncbi:MAG: hypothetical protein R6U63_00625 [Longimicrobiales bacterium]
MQYLRMFLVAALIPGALGAQAAAPQTGMESVPFRLAGMELELTVDYGRQWLDGRATLTVENWTDRPAPELTVAVGRLMQVETVTGPDGAPLPFHQEVTAFQDWTLRQANFVYVELPGPVAPGDSVPVTVTYAGHLVGATETGMRYVQDHIDPAFTVLRAEAFAFPQVTGPSMASTRTVPRRTFPFSARVTVPETLVVATGGETVNRTTADGRATYDVRSRRPVPFLNMTIAPYEVYEHGGIRLYLFPEDTARGPELLQTVTRALDWFRARYGELPRAPAFSLMEIPDGYGSQAHLDAGIMIEASALAPEESRAHLYHELSHFWNAPDAETPSPRWNEGLAMYLQERVAMELDGSDLGRAQAAMARSVCRRARESEAVRTTPLEAYGKADMTRWSYSVGAVLFHVLDGVMGSAALDRAYRGLYQAEKSGTVSVQELEAAFTRVEPRTQAVFDEWVHTAEWYDTLCVEHGGHLDAVMAGYR